MITRAVLATIIVFSITGYTAETTVDPHCRQAVVGEYLWANVGRTYSLSIRSNGVFVIVWRGCEGVYGSAKGLWDLTDRKIILNPKRRTANMRKFPMAFSIIKRGNYNCLTTDVNDSALAQLGICYSTAFCPEGIQELYSPTRRTE